MSFSVFSFLMAIVWCNLFIVVFALIRRRNGFIANFSIVPLFFLLLLCLSRLFFSFEPSGIFVIRSERILPAIIDFLTMPRMFFGNNFSLLELFLLVWAAGSAVYACSYIRQAVRLNRCLCKVAGTTNPQVLTCMNEILMEGGKNTDVKIIQSPEIAVPMVTGFFKPTIYLPDIPFADAELRYILSHEWTHFQHRDAWAKLGMYLALTVFWWNPFLHILSTNLNYILEIRCDLKLTSKMDEAGRIEYLESIQRILKHRHSIKKSTNYKHLASALVLSNANNARPIEQRFHLVLNSKRCKKKFRAFSVLLYAALITMLLFSYAFIIQPHWSSPANEACFSITPENAYLCLNADNTYALYTTDGGTVQYQCTLAEVNLSEQPFSSLPIKQEN